MQTKQILPLFVLLLLVSGTLVAGDCQDTVVFLQQKTEPNKDVTLYAYVNSNIAGGSAVAASDAILDFVSTAKPEPICKGVLPTKKTVDTGDIYEYTCTIKESDFTGQCNSVSAVVKGPAKYCKAEASTMVCDYSSTTFPLISNEISNAIAKTTSQNYGFCLAAFVMLGILLSTMFYSGKSPMSLLNITTPNLPSPKSLAASGQVLGHMVYGRMKKMYVTTLDMLGKQMELHSKDLEASLKASAAASSSAKKAATIAQINALFANMRGDPHTRTVLRFLALSMAADGAAIEDIRKIVRGKSLFAYSKEEHIEVGRVVQNLKKKDKRMGAAAGNMVDKYIQTYIALNKMRMLTGESGENRGFLDVAYWFARTPVEGLQAIQKAPYIGGSKWVKKVFENKPMKFVSGIGLSHFPIIGGFVGTSIDAFFRSIRITGRYGQVVGGSIARGVARKTGMVDSAKLKSMGESLDKERVGEQSIGYFKRMAYATLTAGSPETTKAGGMYPIFMKAAELYNQNQKDGHYDAIYYLMKQLYGKYGVTFDKLNDKQVASFMFKDADIAELANLKRNPNIREIHAMEQEIRSILSRKPNPLDPNGELIDLRAKIDDLKKLARTLGVHVDPRMDAFLEDLRRIHDSGEEDHVKFLLLRNYLVENHQVDQAGYMPQDRAGPNDFYVLLGRDNLGRDRFSHHVIRNMVFSAENDSLHGGLEDALKQMWVYIVNRSRSLAPIGDDPETRAITSRINTYMHDLMTDEGRAAALKFSGNADNWNCILTGEAQMKDKLGAKGSEIYVEFGDKGRAGILRTTLEKMVSRGILSQSILDAIDKGLDVTIRQAFPSFFKAGASVAYYKKGGTPIYWSDENVLGPSKTWWKVDMKRDWQTSGGSEQTLQYYVDGIFGKGYKMPYKASIFRELMGSDGLLHDPEGKVRSCDPNRITKEFAEKVLKPAFMKNALFNELDNFLNGVMAMNSYKYYNETSRFYVKLMQGMLLGAASAQLKQDLEQEKNPVVARRIASDLESISNQIESMNPVSNQADLRMLIELLRGNKELVKNFVEKPFTYDFIEKSPHAWVMLHEGGFAPFIKGMPLSDFDRAMGGFVALKDSNGKWRRFDPQNVDITFGTDAEALALRREFAGLQSQRDSQKWENFLSVAADWAKGNPDRQKQYNAVLWRYAQTTDDWHGFWDRSDITIRPKHEVLGVRPAILPYPSSNEASASIMEPLRKIREWGRGVGLWMERSSLYAAGNVYSSSYEIVPTSKYVALQLLDYARDIRLYTPEQLGVSASTHEEMQKLADHVTSKILLTQDFGIDRHPGRHSTSHGLQNALASSFHYGPAATWDPRWYKAFFSKTEYVPYAMATWPAQIVRYMALPAITAFRGFQMSLFGYPNKWNYQESAMQPFQYRNPDVIGAFRSIFNPFHSSLNWFSSPFFGGSGEMIERDMGGAKFRRGLKQIPEEMNWIGKGTQYWARVGTSNPGETRLNPRMIPEIAPPMAEYLAHRDRFAGYYSQDPNIQKQAYTTYIKREVSGPALMIRREEELRGYAPLSNPIWGWTSPAMFLWHLPGSPISPRDLFMHYKEGKRRMDWDNMSFAQKTSQVVFGGGGSMLSGISANLKPWYTDETGQTKMYGLGGRLGQGTTRNIISCPSCGGLIQRWGACPRCSRRRP